MICAGKTRQKSWLGPLLPFLLVTMLAAGPAHAQVLMNGAGATFPFPIYSKWFDEYAKVDPSVRVNYEVGAADGRY
jgi:phosphate transport system substrate-binding protein